MFLLIQRTFEGKKKSNIGVISIDVIFPLISNVAFFCQVNVTEENVIRNFVTKVNKTREAVSLLARQLSSYAHSNEEYAPHLPFERIEVNSISCYVYIL